MVSIFVGSDASNDRLMSGGTNVLNFARQERAERRVVALVKLELWRSLPGRKEVEVVVSARR